MLDNKDNRNPFSVPENYFQNFNAEIMNKLPDKKNIETERKKIVPLWKTASRWIAAAAVVAGMALVGVFYMDNNTRTSNGNTTTNAIALDENGVALESDYYQFLEEEATRIAYRNAFFDDDL